MRKEREQGAHVGELLRVDGRAATCPGGHRSTSLIPTSHSSNVHEHHDAHAHHSGLRHCREPAASSSVCTSCPPSRNLLLPRRRADQSPSATAQRAELAGSIHIHIHQPDNELSTRRHGPRKRHRVRLRRLSPPVPQHGRRAARRCARPVLFKKPEPLRRHIHRSRADSSSRRGSSTTSSP